MPSMCCWLPQWGAAAALLLVLQAGLTLALTTSNTALIIARDEEAASGIYEGFNGYGIPYETLIVSDAGIGLPELTSSETDGNYGSIVIVSEVQYDYSGVFASALTSKQWQDLYDYQEKFGVRMVRLDAFPTSDFGVSPGLIGSGCCNEGVEQLVSLTDASEFPTANLKTGAGISTLGLWHYPALVTNDSIAVSFAEFAPAGEFRDVTTAGVINRIGDREQMVLFLGWAADWSIASNYLQHAFIHWMTRGLFVGKRKTYLNTQIDDVHLDTELYEPVLGVFRLRVVDLDAHKFWQTNLNARLPPGSNYFMEMGHNGNGDIIVATDRPIGVWYCDPAYAVDYPEVPDPPLEWMKPIGTGTDQWEAVFQEYTWTEECAALDPVATWFMDAANRDAFAHVSHTFSHENLDNATYDDAWREIAFNRDWLYQTRIADAARFSPEGIIPPAITGLHNGDAIQAWMDNGIFYVAGDNSRPILRNEESEFWPRISTVESNGKDGLVMFPRWASGIYYNCDTVACNMAQWQNITGVDGSWEDFLRTTRDMYTRLLLGLHPDPYMFHQANMRQFDVNPVTIGPLTDRFSLVQIWVELITQEMMRLTNWPFHSLKHDDVAHLFLDRMTLDNCKPNIRYNYSEDGTAISSVTLTTEGNICDVPVPVTFPGTASTLQNATDDKVGSEPLIIWATMAGDPVEFTLNRPISLYKT